MDEHLEMDYEDKNGNNVDYDDWDDIGTFDADYNDEYEYDSPDYEDEPGEEYITYDSPSIEDTISEWPSYGN